MMKKTMTKLFDLQEKINWGKNHFLIYSIIILVISTVVYSYHLSPALYYDDWGQFAHKYFRGDLPWFIPGFVRPLSFATYRLETELFGMNLSSIMILRIGLLSVHGLLFFIILEKLRVFPSLLNFISALLILFTPVDMTRMWLLLDPIMFICVQIYMVCLIDFCQKKSFLALTLGGILGFGSLLYYEIQLGLIIAFPVFLFIYYWIKEKKYYWWMALPFTIGVAYLSFRAFGSIFDLMCFHSAQTVSARFVLHQIKNIIFSFIDGWTLPLRMDIFIRNISIGVTLLSLSIFLFFIIKYGLEKDFKKYLFTSGLIFIFGIFFWVAGYFPWVVYGIPSYIHWFSSRAHNTAIPGAAIAFIAVCSVLGLLVKVSPDKKPVLSAILALPLIVVGVLSQMAIQRETHSLWREYQVMWKGVFFAVPDFIGNPHIVFVISPFGNNYRYGEREFFTNASYNVEISKALEIFYANGRLEGEFIYKDRELPDTPTLHKEGIRNPPTYSGLIPYKDIVFIEYDRLRRKVNVIRDLKKEFGIDNPMYDVNKFISKKPMDRKSLRYIILE